MAIIASFAPVALEIEPVTLAVVSSVQGVDYAMDGAAG